MFTSLEKCMFTIYIWTIFPEAIVYSWDRHRPAPDVIRRRRPGFEPVPRIPAENLSDVLVSIQVQSSLPFVSSIETLLTLLHMTQTYFSFCLILMPSKHIIHVFDFLIVFTECLG